MNTKLLRQKILDLAIRGKLTQQKKSDGTTRDLLKQIQDERTGEALQTRDSSTCHCEAQKRRGNLKQSKSATPKEIIPLDKSEAPFEIPENWEWVRLGNIASDFQYGSSEKSKPEGKVAVLRMGNINRMGQVVYDDLVYTSTESEITKYALDVGDVLFNRTNSPEWVGKTALYRGEIPAIYAGYIIRIKPKFLPEYLNYLMCSKYERDWAHEVKTDGVHQSNINAQKLIEFAVPLPPLAEQQRIVTAIENAFAEITEIENNQELLKKHIKQGRQKILDLAIRGKLTQQLKTDGTTKDLLKQIQDERTGEALQTRDSSTCHCEAQKRRGNLKQSKSAFSKEIIPLDKSETPFEIPSSWEWVKLGDVCKLLNGDRGTNYPSKNDYIEEGIPFINAGCLNEGIVDYSKSHFISESKFYSLRAGKVQRGDVLYCLRGSLGKCGVIDHDNPAAISSSLCIFRFSSAVDHTFAIYFLQSTYVKDQQNVVDNGTAQPNLSAKDVAEYILPLPPLAEQQRIVATIKQAFAEFDAMEKHYS